MAKIPQMEYIVKKNYIDIMVPLTSTGKFRCKTRNSFQEFGKGMAPKSEKIPENAYVEWQIGYDIKITDKKRKTMLTNLVFTGANKKKKYPYELSEILYNLCKINLITKSEINNLILTINNMNDFLQEMFVIQTEFEKKVNINDEEFFKSVITLPTFHKANESCGVVVEISIEKQQYATGVQPMLYMSIPVKEFENNSNIINKTSSETKYGVLRIDKKKIDVITNLFLCFGMCSKAHHHDIIEILKLIAVEGFK